MTESQDEYQLRLLEIFHYVVAALEALFACLPLIHVGIGLAMIFAPESMAGNHGKPPPAFLGWVFVGLGSAIIFLGWTLATCVAYAGRCIRNRRHLTYCLVIAALNCGFMPFGTVLGVFSFVVLLRPGMKERFGEAAAAGS